MLYQERSLGQDFILSTRHRLDIKVRATTETQTVFVSFFVFFWISFLQLVTAVFADLYKIRNRETFMFLTDVVLGKPHVAKESYGWTQPPKGHQFKCLSFTVFGRIYSELYKMNKF